MGWDKHTLGFIKLLYINHSATRIGIELLRQHKQIKDKGPDYYTTVFPFLGKRIELGIDEGEAIPLIADISHAINVAASIQGSQDSQCYRGSAPTLRYISVPDVLARNHDYTLIYPSSVIKNVQ